MKPKPGTEVATLLANLAGSARDGNITDVYVVARGKDGTYAEAYYADDIDEMLLEVGSAKIRTRMELTKAQDRTQ